MHTPFSIISGNAFIFYHNVFFFIIGDKVFAHFHWDFETLLFRIDLQDLGIGRFPCYYSGLQVSPHIFNQFQVWTLSCPLRNNDIVLCQQCLDHFVCFGSLNQGKVHCIPRPSFSADCLMFCSKCFEGVSSFQCRGHFCLSTTSFQIVYCVKLRKLLQ